MKFLKIILSLSFIGSVALVAMEREEINNATLYSTQLQSQLMTPDMIKNMVETKLKKEQLRDQVRNRINDLRIQIENDINKYDDYYVTPLGNTYKTYKLSVLLKKETDSFIHDSESLLADLHRLSFEDNTLKQKALTALLNSWDELPKKIAKKKLVFNTEKLSYEKNILEEQYEKELKQINELEQVIKESKGRLDKYKGTDAIKGFSIFGGMFSYAFLLGYMEYLKQHTVLISPKLSIPILVLPLICGMKFVANWGKDTRDMKDLAADLLIKERRLEKLEEIFRVTGFQKGFKDDALKYNYKKIYELK